VLLPFLKSRRLKDQITSCKSLATDCCWQMLVLACAGSSGLHGAPAHTPSGLAMPACVCFIKTHLLHDCLLLQLLLHLLCRLLQLTGLSTHGGEVSSETPFLCLSLASAAPSKDMEC
jgi:hypothetical protein